MRLRKPRLFLKTVGGALALLIVVPVRDLARTLRQKHPVRVFTFHRISELSRDDLTVSPGTFRRQLQYIRKHHDIVDIEHGLELLESSARLKRPAAVLTFDDAYRSVYEIGAAMLAEFKLRGCCFATTDLVGTERWFPWDSDSPVRDFLSVMNWEELRELRRMGWTIGSHTATHPRLADCDDARLRHELEASLDALRTRLNLGSGSVPLAYPFGGPSDISDKGLRLVHEVGYRACCSNFGGENRPPVSSYDIRRIDIGGDHGTLAWKTRARGIALADWTRWWEKRV